jgi:O-phosphoseryl-tRNA(Cys) synthetase
MDATSEIFNLLSVERTEKVEMLGVVFPPLRHLVLQESTVITAQSAGGAGSLSTSHP